MEKWRIGNRVMWGDKAYHITAKVENKLNGEIVWTLNRTFNAPHKFVTVYENEMGRFEEYKEYDYR